MKLLFRLVPLVLLALIAAACTGDDGGEIEVGADAPDFTLPNATGGEVSLSDFEGQPVLLYFHMAVG
jgi:cytochrome oxidase Cu insertion factor (SCO1/SenC/PrrC family)